MAAAPIVAPAVRITARALLIPLLELMGFVVAVGLIYVVDYFCRALFGAAEGVISWVPWLGKKASKGLHAVEQRLVHAMGAAEAPLERKIGTAATQLAHVIAGVAETLAALAIIAAYLQWLIVYKYPSHIIWQQLQKLGHGTKVIVTKQTTVIRKTRVIEKQIAGATTGKLGAAIRVATKPIAAAIAAAVAVLYPRIKALEGATTIRLPRSIGEVRARERALERKVGALGRQLRAIAKPGVGVVALGAVAAAIARLGWGFLKCTNVKRTGKHLCGMDGDLLEALIAGSLIVAGSVSIVDLARGLEAIMGEATDAVTGFVREA